jgi:hypothetical protein
MHLISVFFVLVFGEPREKGTYLGWGKEETGGEREKEEEWERVGCVFHFFPFHTCRLLFRRIIQTFAVEE